MAGDFTPKQALELMLAMNPLDFELDRLQKNHEEFKEILAAMAAKIVQAMERVKVYNPLTFGEAHRAAHTYFLLAECKSKLHGATQDYFAAWAAAAALEDKAARKTAMQEASNAMGSRCIEISADADSKRFGRELGGPLLA